MTGVQTCALPILLRALTHRSYANESEGSGIEHNERGAPTASGEVHARMNDKRINKLDPLKRRRDLFAIEGDLHAPLALVAWGSLAGTAREALGEAGSEVDAGFDLKYGLTSNLTADFTYNPDFSQIESDQPQIEINQRFPLLFAELRPFFLEGQEIFQVPGPVGTLLNTRTILDPQYGLKLSGKTGRTLIGVVAANDQAPGKVDNPLDPLFGQAAQVFAARARVDVYRQSYLGFMVTNREFASSHSRLAMVDGAFAIGPSIRTGFQVVYSDRLGLDGRQIGRAHV